MISLVVNFCHFATFFFGKKNIPSQIPYILGKKSKIATIV
jgi:hypothetical protein